MLRYFFIAVNILSFIFYGIDKFSAKLHYSRIPERILLRISLFGGVYGSILGMILFHHKTRKKIFGRVNGICFIIYTIFLYSMWRYL